MKYLFIKLRILYLTLLFIISLPLASEAKGSTEQVATQFRSAVQLFKEGNYEQALQLFLKAKSLGMEKGSLYYNVGVCYYKLSLFDEAEQAFRKTASFPEMAPLAYYNLGIIALKQSEQEKAEYWLMQSYNKTDDEKLRLLAKTALNRIDKKEDLSLWERYLSMGLGYDDNVELYINSETLESSDQGDNFIDFFLFLRRPLSGSTATTGPVFQSSLSYLKYFELNEYDIGNINLGLMYRNKVQNIQLESGGEYSFTLIDGDSYEQSPGFKIQAIYPVNTSHAFRFRYRLNYLDIIDSEYDYLSGWRHRASAEISRRVSQYKAHLAYTLELNDRDDENYSPTRHTFAAGLILRHFENVDISFFISHRESCYDIEYAKDREDDRIDTSINLTYFFRDGWEVSGKYQHIDNDSNYSSYDFTRNVITFSVARFF